MYHAPLSIEDLAHTYPDGTEALQGIARSIEATRRVALAGANGSGKSTLLLHLNGILAPRRGKVTVGPYPVEPTDRVLTDGEFLEKHDLETPWLTAVPIVSWRTHRSPPMSGMEKS